MRKAFFCIIALLGLTSMSFAIAPSSVGCPIGYRLVNSIQVNTSNQATSTVQFTTTTAPGGDPAWDNQTFVIDRAQYSSVEDYKAVIAMLYSAKLNGLPFHLSCQYNSPNTTALDVVYRITLN